LRPCEPVPFEGLVGQLGGGNPGALSRAVGTDERTDKEKAILAVGNAAGVKKVDDRIRVEAHTPDRPAARPGSQGPRRTTRGAASQPRRTS
jgi:hypothetical protein